MSEEILVQMSQQLGELNGTLKQALAALTASDLVAVRCMKAGVSFPSAWQTYVSELRSIISSGSGTIPTKPAYPAGT